MWGFLTDLFDTSQFPPRWYCGEWSSELGWLHIGSDLTTFAAYTAIPVLLAYFVLRRRDAPFPRIFWLFVGFIFSCGAVHLIEAIIFWEPIYRFSGVVKATTAALSVATVVALIPTLPRALALPTAGGIKSNLAAIVSASTEAILSKTLDGEVQSWNGAAEQMYGYSAEEMIGRSIRTIVPEDRRAELEEILDCLRRGEHVQHFETERLTKDGRRISVSLSIAPLRDETGAITGASSIARDVTAQKRNEKVLRATARRLERANRRLRKLADRDPLTGLLNRRGLESTLLIEVERIRRQGTRSAVILIDCDDFKYVNDRFGHDGGDEVLREVAERIQDASRESDRVARIGGDEFMVVAPDTRTAEAVLLAQRIRLAVSGSPIELAGGETTVRISCGVEPVDPRSRSLDDLIARTSTSLARSKSAGKNRVATGLDEPATDVDISLAVLEPIAQPIIRISNGQTVGLEFLIRGPAGPFRLPHDLFRACRERDSLTRVDLQCLQQCIEAGNRVDEHLQLHINLFPSTVIEAEEDAIETRIRGLARSDRLCIELNEAMLIGDPVVLAPRTREIRGATGCRLAIDDVGFGRSSLEALIVLEPDIIKIDRGYVRGAHADRGQRHHLSRLIHVGHALGAEIIAEGVEEEVDRSILADLGVDLAQGFYWAAPAPLEPAL